MKAIQKCQKEGVGQCCPSKSNLFESDFVQQRTHSQNGRYILQMHGFYGVVCNFDFKATDVVRNVWIVGEETNELAGSQPTLADGIVVIKGDAGIEMSVDKWY